jgi:hypothetical protein
VPDGALEQCTHHAEKWFQVSHSAAWTYLCQDCPPLCTEKPAATRAELMKLAINAAVAAWASICSAITRNLLSHSKPEILNLGLFRHIGSVSCLSASLAEYQTICTG